MLVIPSALLTLLVVAVGAAPSHPHGYALPASHAQVHETYHAGQPIVQTHVKHGIIGSKTVKVGYKTVQVGSEYVPVGQTIEQPSPYSYVAGAPSLTKSTVQLPLAPLPIASPNVAIPPAPRNLGPAPADTVTSEKILAPVRTHSVITPQVKRVVPELKINKVPVDVPVAVPVPVEREVIIEKRVLKPYTVEVPQPVAVPQPYKVHPIKQIVQTPIIHKQTYSVERPIGYAVAQPAIAAAYTHGALPAGIPVPFGHY